MDVKVYPPNGPLFTDLYNSWGTLYAFCIQTIEWVIDDDKIIRPDIIFGRNGFWQINANAKCARSMRLGDQTLEADGVEERNFVCTERWHGRDHHSSD